jgi:hypothetical protein
MASTTDIVIENNVFENILGELNEFFGKIEHGADNFLDVLVKAMELVEAWADSVKKQMVVHGMEKKELVEELMMKMKERFEDAHDAVEAQVKFWMDKLIDILVSAARHKIEFNKAIEEIKTNGCMPCRRLAPVAEPKDVGTVETITEQVHNDIKNAIKNRVFTADNFIVLVTLVMQFMGKFPNLSGQEKKLVAVSVIKRLVMEIPFPEGHKDMIELIIDTSLSKTIDLIISAANGELDISKVVETVKSVFVCCK